MSSHYALEPQPTAKLLLNTTSGPITLELFANQAPLACRNFLQHSLDGYYDSTVFHRVVPDFLVQGGDPTGTGAGGESIYEDDPETNFKDEIHSRLRFNRRGLVGMAKSEGESYGSQFFITLAPAEFELNGKCTLFGRVVSGSDSIFNVIKIAEGELVEGMERPLYPTKIESVEVLVNPFEGMIARRKETVKTTQEKDKKKSIGKKKKTAGKALLSFGGDEVGDDIDYAPVVKKPKFNTSLVSSGPDVEKGLDKAGKTPKSQRRRSLSPKEPPVPSNNPSKPQPLRSSMMYPKRPKQPSPDSQLPLRDPEVPSRSPSPSSSPEPDADRDASLSNVSSLVARTNAQIDELKASMKRNIPTTSTDTGKKRSALEQLIPSNSIRGRKRRHGLDSNNAPGPGDAESLRLLSAFKSKLDQADFGSSSPSATKQNGIHDDKNIASATAAAGVGEEGEEEERDEEDVCDLHFIANCQSCRSWDDVEAAKNDKKKKKKRKGKAGENDDDDDDDDKGWMSHTLSFEKDRLGKDLKWRQQMNEELVLIDPREKGKQIRAEKKRKGG